ncbi:uncharacterized protein LOC113364169 [Ctenocephalides felis]|uniref:uncharacterized protein LOC113364169 n=1 Tax=Ctenocephalides felis TaxID=7515 RepID=UPI000E6E3BE6|nr:uncharacterized protein LOC113364169 [Ctenocephalides felis]
MIVRRCVCRQTEALRRLCKAEDREGQMYYANVRLCSSTISHSIPRIRITAQDKDKDMSRAQATPITYHLVALPTTRIGLPLREDIISFSTPAVYGVRCTARRVSAKWT